MLPDVDVQIIDSPPPAATQIDTGTFFASGLSDRGVTAGALRTTDAVSTLGDFITRYGARQSYNGPLFDAVESYLAEGGSRVYFSRQAGPSAVKATAAVPVSSSQFNAIAKGPGSYGNNLKVGVATSVVTVKDGTTIVEISPTLADLNALVTWASTVSTYIDVTLIAAGVTALTNSADVTLASGTDDRGNITATEKQTSLDRFVKSLGPGQVAMPGDATVYQKLAQHALDNNRFAYGDGADSSTTATVISAAGVVRALGKDLARHIQILEPWLYVDQGSVAGRRTVPPCGVMAGLAAKVDAAGNPNLAVAGPRAVSRFVTAPKYERTDTERSGLADAGVTVIRTVDGQVQPYDDVTPVDGVAYPQWLGASGNRFVMRVIVDALAIAKPHMFGQPPKNIADFDGDLNGMLLGWYVKGALFSATPNTPSEAFRVVTGPPINTSTTIAARQLRAALALTIAENNRQVLVQITNVPLGTAL